MSQAVMEGQTIRGRGSVADYSNLVKLPHTVFALPFALVGATLGSYHAEVRIRTVALILLAFTSARFAAMGFNRIVDRAIDGRNPRTVAREIPSGRLSVRQAVVAVTLAGVVFLASAAFLNPLCALLAPFALVWIFFYSYTKRFTRWAHLVLGASLAIAPVGAYLAVVGRWSEPPATLLLLAGAVATWVAGFDILYSLQDLDFDRSEGLHSVPAAFGARGALRVSRALHAACVLCFFGVGWVAPELGTLYTFGAAMAATLLVYEQSLVRENDFSRIDAAFFNVNGFISMALFALVLLERFLA